MENNTDMTAKTSETPKPTGGLYSKVKVSVRTMNIIIAVGLAALVIVLVFVATHNGFTITFDTDGGSKIASVVGKYGEKLEEPAAPVREGSVFTGWYSDAACTKLWDFSKDTPDGDMTLYAGWRDKE